MRVVNVSARDVDAHAISCWSIRALASSVCGSVEGGMEAGQDACCIADPVRPGHGHAPWQAVRIWLRGRCNTHSHEHKPIDTQPAIQEPRTFYLMPQSFPPFRSIFARPVSTTSSSGDPKSTDEWASACGFVRAWALVAWRSGGDWLDRGVNRRRMLEG